MPDTAANQESWPQPVTQKAGCGFSVVKLVACFCLANGGLLDWIQGQLRERLFPKLLAVSQNGDVVLADRCLTAKDGSGRIAELPPAAW